MGLHWINNLKNKYTIKNEENEQYKKQLNNKMITTQHYTYIQASGGYWLQWPLSYEDELIVREN